MTIPSRFGGMGLGHVAKTVVIEELARVSGAMGAMAQASQLGVAKVVHFGTEGQQARWLPRFGRRRSASDDRGDRARVGRPRARHARHRGPGRRLLRARRDEVRSWATPTSATMHGVVARDGPGSRGLTAFLVEHDRPGLRLGGYGTPAGLHGFSYGELVFEGCRVPIENRIGDEGQGLDVAYSSSTLYGRPNLTAVALGIHQAIFEDTVAFCRERELYGEPLAQLPTVALKLGEMQSRLMTARLLAYHAAHLLDQGRACDAELMNAQARQHRVGAHVGARGARDLFAGRGGQREHHDRALPARRDPSRAPPRARPTCSVSGLPRWRPVSTRATGRSASVRSRACRRSRRRRAPVGRPSGERQCPECGAAIPVLPGYPDWCERCDWNLVKPPSLDGGKGRFARVVGALGRRAGERMAAELRAAGELRPRWSSAKAAAYAVAAGVHLLTLALIAGGVAAIVVEFPNPASILIGLAMVSVRADAAPRAGGSATGIPSSCPRRRRCMRSPAA